MDSLVKSRWKHRTIGALGLGCALLGFAFWQIVQQRARDTAIVGYWIFADDLDEGTAGRERWVIRDDGVVDASYWTYSQSAPRDDGGMAPSHSWLPSGSGRWARVGDAWEISWHPDWTPPRAASMWQRVRARLGFSVPPPGPPGLRAELLPDGQLRVPSSGHDRLVRVPVDFVCPERAMRPDEIAALLSAGRLAAN
jgi:hypothetical protein